MRRTSHLRNRVGTALLVAVPILFLAWFFLWPLVAILRLGLAPEGRLDLTAFAEILARPTLRSAIWFTVWQAAVSTVLTLLAALPLTYVLSRYDFPGRALVRAAVTVPFVLPTVVVGTAFLALVGPSGILGVDLSRTVVAIVAAHVFYNFAVVVRTVGGLWSHLDPRMEEAARVLGASRWRTFREVTFPLLRPAIAAAASIVFLFSFTSFGVVLILGGLRYRTIEVEIWRQTVQLLDLPVAAALSIVQLVGIGLLLGLYSREQERRAVEQRLRPAAEVARRPRTLGERLVVAGNLAFAAVYLGTPLAILVGRSLRTTDGWGLDHYRALGAEQVSALFVPPAEAIANSMTFAVVAMVVALVVGTTAAAVVAYRRGPISRFFDVLLMLPLGTSAVTIGFGFLVALDRPIDLRTSPWLIPLAHALVAVPFVVRTVVPVMRAVQTRLREAAMVLGASPAVAWREIDLPLVARAVLVGAGFALAVSLGEFGATAFIARPDRPTVPIAIFRLLGQPGAGTFGMAMAMSTILMVLTALSVLAVERFRLGEVGEF